MVAVERVVTLDHPLEDVVRYLADFSNAREWDPGTVTCERLGDGPVAPGTEWRNVSEFLGRRTELRYRLVRREADRLTFVGRNGTATSTDDMRFEAQPGGTRLLYRADVDFHGLARLAAPLLQRAFERLGDQVAEQLPRAVDRALGRLPSNDDLLG
ncbi:SRPBCC family protein [Streptomyces sp. NPDC047000]|uniref:SRPBCC family protein n=1 Tax=Streptomyces sp. NPDC047000 TaxID=3155474 RepID=UPI0033F15286